VGADRDRSRVARLPIPPTRRHTLTLTRISLATGVIVAAFNLAVLFGLDLTDIQLAGINTFLVTVGAAIHSWYNPDVPIGNTG
jgi:hypothetical protein